MVARHVPRQGHSRSTHGRIVRPSHGHAAYDVPIVANQEYYEQLQIDQGEQLTEQFIAPGSINSWAFQPGVIDITPFADTIRPVVIVDTLPTLPDADFPELSYVVLTTDERLYKNIGDVWVLGVDGADIVANSITAGQIAAGAINASEIAAGAITVEKLALVDESGETLLDAQGFGPTWRRFIQSGVYNGDFGSPTASVASDIHNSTNPLPYWEYFQETGTAITARVVDDTSVPSGHLVRFTMASGATDDDTYLIQVVPIRASMRRDGVARVYASFRSTADGDAEAVAYLVYLDSTGAECSSISFGSFTLTEINSEPDDVMSVVVLQGAIPTEAAYAKVGVGMRRALGQPTSDTGTVDLCDVRLSHFSGSVLVPDVVDHANEPGALYKAANIVWILSGDVGNNPQIGLSGTNGNIRPILGSGGAFIIENDSAAEIFRVREGGAVAQGGTSFPSSPSANDLFFRTDLDMWFIWAFGASNWLTTQVFQQQMIHAHTTPLPFSATVSGAFRFSAPVGPNDVWLENIVTGFQVAGGGTALSGSHKWVGTVFSEEGSNSTARGTITIDSGSSGVWRQSLVNMNQLQGTAYEWYVTWTKTGTPGDLYVVQHINYRLVAT